MGKVKEQSRDLTGKINSRTKKKRRKMSKGRYEETLEHVEHGCRIPMYI